MCVCMYSLMLHVLSSTWLGCVNAGGRLQIWNLYKSTYIHTHKIVFCDLLHNRKYTNRYFIYFYIYIFFFLIAHIMSNMSFDKRYQTHCNTSSVICQTCDLVIKTSFCCCLLCPILILHTSLQTFFLFSLTTTSSFKW